MESHGHGRPGTAAGSGSALVRLSGVIWRRPGLPFELTLIETSSRLGVA